ncbi:hypothetical protein GCM10027569_34410 [Flindersiella endophytica]
MRAPNRPTAYVNHINHLYIPTRAGACAGVSGDVEKLTGRPPAHLPRLRRGDVVSVRRHAAAFSGLFDIPLGRR